MLSFIRTIPLLVPHRYKPLPSSGEDDETSFSKTGVGDTSHRAPESTPPKRSRIALYSVILCVLCTVAQISAGLINHLYPPIFSLSLYELQSPARTDLKNLRRPSQFKGLDKIERPVPPTPKEIINFPLRLGRVDEGNPRAVITGGRKSRRIVQGVEGRKAEVRNTISTIIQFRMIDWGMESCTLNVRFPRKIDSSNSDITLDRDENQIDVFRLRSDSVIDLDSLSYHTRPPVEGKVATMNGTDSNYQFECPMDSLHTFALTAGTGHASVEWWQDKQTQFPAVYITQQSTR